VLESQDKLVIDKQDTPRNRMLVLLFIWYLPFVEYKHEEPEFLLGENEVSRSFQCHCNVLFVTGGGLWVCQPLK